MVSVTDFHKIVFEYLTGSVDRKVFTHRFAELFYNVEKHGDPSAIALAYAIESHLAEAITGLIPEEELRVALSKCVIETHVCDGFRADSTVGLVKEDTSSPYKRADVVFA